MEELETGVETVQENIHHEALHEGMPKWFTTSAVMSAGFAVLAAVASLFSGHHANEAILDQMRASDQWAFYQAKGIKATVLESGAALLTELGKQPSADYEQKRERYREEQKEIEQEAREKENGSHNHFAVHGILAKSVTLFQIAIGLVAIAVLTRKRRVLLLATAFAVGGAIFFVQGVMH